MHMILFTFLIITNAFALQETVYVESPTDTDNDGRKDRIYLSISRPLTDKKLSTRFSISPYTLDGNNTTSHNVDLDLLPQDLAVTPKIFTHRVDNQDIINETFSLSSLAPSKKKYLTNNTAYARVSAHSLGTGYSSGCPTVGDYSEALAGKAVIDWLNGRAKAFYEDGSEAKAQWANGNVDGTLPTMIATTGVEGLKAIVPIGAISNWYDYYRANGLVVGPGGYIGEDADELGYYIVRKNSCNKELLNIANSIRRDTGDFNTFWQRRDYTHLLKNIKAATFIIHGQSDWNVKQKHAINLWQNLPKDVPKKMFLHRGGHSMPLSHNIVTKMNQWIEYFLESKGGDILKSPKVEVELRDRRLISQNEWPHEKSKRKRLYFMENGSLSTKKALARENQLTITDTGRINTIKKLAENPTQAHDGRLIFLSDTLDVDTLLSGSPRVKLNLAVKNRRAANITVALVEYFDDGTKHIITRGWADPQNYQSISKGESLIPGEDYTLIFDLEPKQYSISKGSQIGVMLASTDYNYTIRPNAGTEIQFNLGPESFIDIRTLTSY